MKFVRFAAALLCSFALAACGDDLFEGRSCDQLRTDLDNLVVERARFTGDGDDKTIKTLDDLVADLRDELSNRC